MARLTKNQKIAQAKVDAAKEYSLVEACALVKDITTTKFDASVDLDIRLGVDPRKANQMVRGISVLPHGTGKTVRVLVLCTPDKEQEAKDAGADFVGMDDYIAKIEQGWTDVDIIITMPALMAKVGKLGRVLGPRNLMPNPKVGTVTMDVKGAVDAAKGGEVQFKVEKAGVIHGGIGKVSFTEEALAQNVRAFVEAVSRARPTGAKGAYLKKVSLSSTMGPGVTVDTASATAN